MCVLCHMCAGTCRVQRGTRFPTVVSHLIWVLEPNGSSGRATSVMNTVLSPTLSRWHCDVFFTYWAGRVFLNLPPNFLVLGLLSSRASATLRSRCCVGFWCIQDRLEDECCSSMRSRSLSSGPQNLSESFQSLTVPPHFSHFSRQSKTLSGQIPTLISAALKCQFLLLKLGSAVPLLESQHVHPETLHPAIPAQIGKLHTLMLSCISPPPFPKPLLFL